MCQSPCSLSNLSRQKSCTTAHSQTETVPAFSPRHTTCSRPSIPRHRSRGTWAGPRRSSSPRLHPSVPALALPNVDAAGPPRSAETSSAALRSDSRRRSKCLRRPPRPCCLHTTLPKRLPLYQATAWSRQFPFPAPQSFLDSRPPPPRSARPASRAATNSANPFLRSPTDTRTQSQYPNSLPGPPRSPDSLPNQTAHSHSETLLAALLWATVGTTLAPAIPPRAFPARLLAQIRRPTSCPHSRVAR